MGRTSPRRAGLVVRAVLTAVVLAGLVSACGSSGGSAAPGSTTTAGPTSTPSTGVPAPPCGSNASPPDRYDHVVWIWMENHSLGQVIGASDAPVATAYSRQCGTATRYSQVGSPSLPNYIAATSGATQGIVDDAGPASHPLTVDNLFRQVRTAGKEERSYQEAMPAPCSLTPSGRYAVKHNPAAYYVGNGDRAACQADDVPLGDLGRGSLADDLAHGTLPAFAFVTPDLCNDTHDCPVATGDAWLGRWLPAIVSSSAYRAGRTAVFVVWDEDSPMPNLVIAPSVPAGTRDAQPTSHLGLLRTTEELLGLPLLPGAAGAASLRPGFRL